MLHESWSLKASGDARFELILLPYWTIMEMLIPTSSGSYSSGCNGTLNLTALTLMALTSLA